MENKNILMARQIAAAVAQAGGRAYYVGGFVRDRLLGIDTKDVDMEIHCIPAPALETVLDRLPELKPIEADDGVARLYRLPGARGNIGLISPVSRHFCAACNRIRLTADGKLRPCLHSSAEYSIKGLDFDGMVEQFQKAVLGKPMCHGELSAVKRSGAGRMMNRIGG